MNWSESVDAALCFGWIDGVRRRIGRRIGALSPGRAGLELFRDRPAGLQQDGTARITSAKKAETRAGRLAKLMRAGAAGTRLR